MVDVMVDAMAAAISQAAPAAAEPSELHQIRRGGRSSDQCFSGDRAAHIAESPVIGSTFGGTQLSAVLLAVARAGPLPEDWNRLTGELRCPHSTAIGKTLRKAGNRAPHDGRAPTPAAAVAEAEKRVLRETIHSSSAI